MNPRPVMLTKESWPVAKLAQFIRHTLDKSKVDELVESLKSEHELPPIFMEVDGGKAVIMDGHHRVAAWAKAGQQDAPVYVFRVR